MHKSFIKTPCCICLVLIRNGSSLLGRVNSVDCTTDDGCKTGQMFEWNENRIAIIAPSC